MESMSLSRCETKIGRDKISGGGWEIIYSGFILILLCFFVMMCAFSNVETTRMEKIVRSFTHSIDVLKGGFGFQTKGDMSDASSDFRADQKRLGPIFEKLVNIENTFGLEDNISISFSDEGLVMRLSDISLFGLGVAEISPSARPLLDKIADVLAEAPHDVRIEGHADNLPIHTPGFPSNWELSTARAVNVLRYVIQSGKCDPKKLSAAGFGEFQPIYPNDTPDHRTKNRRVEFIFSYK
jgi:chemotaxis protein MotB